jgi:hypothetical protein
MMIRIRVIILTVALFHCTMTDAQVLHGRISDSSGDPMGAASVYVSELRQGTTSNSQGFYEIALPSGTWRVTWQFLGYAPVTREVTVTNTDLTADITLQEQLYEIPAVRVSASGEDPAYYIMRKAIGMAPFHLRQVKRYVAEVYIRGGGSIDKIPRMLKRRMKIEADESPLEEGRYYFSESVNMITFNAPDRYIHRVVSSHSSEPVGSDEVSPMNYLEASFYQPVLVDIAISPLAPNAFSHYRFRFLGSTSQDDYVIDKISVTPRRQSQQLFSGVIYIVEDLWAIHSLDLTNENMAGSIRIRQLYTPVESGVWMPVSHEFDADISMMGIKARASYSSAVKYLEVEADRSFTWPSAYSPASADNVMQTEKGTDREEIETLLASDDMSGRDMSRLVRLNKKNAGQARKKEPLEIEEKTSFIIEEDAADKDSAYWASARPIPLTEEERASLSTVTSSSSRLARRDSSTLTLSLGTAGRNKGNGEVMRTINDITGGKRWKLSDRTSLGFEGLVDLKRFSFNTVDGFVAGTGMNLSVKTGEAGRITLAPSARYAFGRNKIMWNVTANILYNPLRQANIFLRAGSQSDEFSSSGINPIVNTVSSLFFRQNWMKLYNSTYVIAGHRSEVTNGLTLSLTAKYEKREPLENITSFSFFRTDRPYSVNLPDNPFVAGEVEGYGSMTPVSHSHAAFTARLSYTPRQRYRLSGGAKVNAGSAYPTFGLTWKHAYNYNDSISGHYDMFMAEIFRRSRFGSLNELRWRIRGGGFINSAYLQLQDMYFFNTQVSPVLLNNYEDAFYLKPYYSISALRFFAEGHIRYTSPALLLKRLPGLSRTLIRENTSFSALWTPDNGLYFEAGYSLSEILFIAELGVYAGFSNLKPEAIALRLILRLE